MSSKCGLAHHYSSLELCHFMILSSMGWKGWSQKRLMNSLRAQMANETIKNEMLVLLDWTLCLPIPYGMKMINDSYTHCHCYHHCFP